MTLVLAFLLSALVFGAATARRATAAEPLLPNLVADPPDNTTLATDSSTGTSRLLLRFNGYVHNQGPGTLDFRGSREKPKVSAKTEEEVERARVKQEGLPQKTEEELASPPMKVFQRLFTTNAGNPEEAEKYIERPHVDEPSGGEILYVSADGHHHWHLQRVAAYSLWNASKTAEVAPAQKVGFCLEDSQHVEAAIGPTKAVYADNVPPFRDFCQQYRPNATSVYEGISPGWRDVYGRELAFQWVDASNVLPGEYWLREDVNPLGAIKEVAGANAPSYATSPTIIPGFDALAQSTSTQVGEADTVTLTSKAWSDSATPMYTIVAQPQHGTLSAVNKNQVTYTPSAGYTGPDSFTYSAADPNSQFPQSPAVATTSITVTPATGKGLLMGDATTTYAVGDVTSTGREEAFQFTAKSSGKVEELQFRTNAVANTGVTSVVLGILADSAGRPGAVLGQAMVSGEPGVNAWVKASGLSVPVVGATKYWLVVLPLGPTGKKLHFNAAATSGGAGNVESLATGLTSLTAEASWEAYNQGPVGFQASGSNVTQPPGGPLLGDATATYAVADVTSAGREEAFQFTAKASGKVEELLFRTNAVANTGVTGVAMGVLADSAGVPGAVLGQAMVSGEPGVNAWVKASGLSVPVVGATKYWLVVLPLGPTGKQLHFNAAATAGGAGNVESLAAGLTSLTAESSWETYNQGPVGFQGIGASTGGAVTARALTRSGSTGTAPEIRRPPATVATQAASPPPSVAMAGAPSSMIAGTSVQLSASVTGDDPHGIWSISAGSIDSSGLYKAPSTPPAGGVVTVIVRSAMGASDRRTIAIVPVPVAKPAPSAPMPVEEEWSSVPRGGRSTLGDSASPPPAVSRPETMLLDHALVMTTAVTAPGRVGLDVYLGKSRLGGCTTKTPADRSFTCRLTLPARVSSRAPLSVVASLRIGQHILRSAHRSEPAPKMTMNGTTGVGNLFDHGRLSTSWRFMCSPASARLRSAALK